jgi:hypothetical protein
LNFRCLKGEVKRTAPSPQKVEETVENAPILSEEIVPNDVEVEEIKEPVEIVSPPEIQNNQGETQEEKVEEIVVDEVESEEKQQDHEEEQVPEENQSE